MKVLALSSSRLGNGGYLANALSYLKTFLGDKPLNIAFVPFASVQKTYDDFGTMVKEALVSLPHTIHTVTTESPREQIEKSDVIMVGGGNTFKLLHDIYQNDLLELIQRKVRSGTPYVGWSAGANITGRSICTTNDMPIIQPKSFTALGFFPFQINPHYFNHVIENHNGETRDQRLEEFVVLNTGIPVVGIPEGTALRLENRNLHFVGDADGVLFRCEWGKLPMKSSIIKGEDLSILLEG